MDHDHHKPPGKGPVAPREAPATDEEIRFHLDIRNGEAQKLIIPNQRTIHADEIGRGGESVAHRVTFRKHDRSFSMVALAPMDVAETPDHGARRYGTHHANNIFTAVTKRSRSESTRLLKLDVTHQTIESGIADQVRNALSARDMSLFKRMLSPRHFSRQHDPDVEAGLNLAQHKVDARFVRVHGSGTMATEGSSDDGNLQLSYKPVILLEEARGHNASQAMAKGKLTARDATLLAAATALKSGKQVEHGLFNADIKPANIMVDKGDDGVLEVRGIDFGLTKPIRHWMRQDTVAGSMGWTCFGITNRVVNASVHHLQEKLTKLGLGDRPGQSRLAATALLAQIGDQVAEGRPLTADDIAGAARAVSVRNPSAGTRIHAALTAAAVDGAQANPAAELGHKILDAVGSSQRPPPELIQQLDHAVSHASAATLLSLLSGRQPLEDELNRTEPGMMTLIVCVDASGPNAARQDLYGKDLDAIVPSMRAQYGQNGEDLCGLLRQVLVADRNVPSSEFARDLTRLAGRLPQDTVHAASSFVLNW